MLTLTKSLFALMIGFIITILFALIVGVILAKMGSKTETVANFFGQFNDIMMEMTSMIMHVAPIGVFCLIANTFAGIGFMAFVPLLKYMISGFNSQNKQKLKTF